MLSRALAHKAKVEADFLAWEEQDQIEDEERILKQLQEKILGEKQLLKSKKERILIETESKIAHAILVSVKSNRSQSCPTMLKMEAQKKRVIQIHFHYQMHHFFKKVWRTAVDKNCTHESNEVLPS